MKANLKPILGLAALGITLLATTVPTWAGSAYKPEVSIQQNRTEISVFGTMAGARYSADSNQYIGCSVNAYPYAYCYARNSAGQSVGCVTYDAQLVEAIQGMTDSSAIRFDLTNRSAACTFIAIFDESHYLK